MKELRNKADYEKEVGSGIVMIDFYSNRCEPCKMLSPLLEELEAALEGKVKLLKVDVEKNLGLAQKHLVINLPTVCVLVDGKEQEKIIGFKPKAILEETIKKYL